MYQGGFLKVQIPLHAILKDVKFVQFQYIPLSDKTSILRDVYINLTYVFLVILFF